VLKAFERFHEVSSVTIVFGAKTTFRPGATTTLHVIHHEGRIRRSSGCPL
jgi:hypothetical protein